METWIKNLRRSHKLETMHLLERISMLEKVSKSTTSTEDDVSPMTESELRVSVGGDPLLGPGIGPHQ